MSFLTDEIIKLALEIEKYRARMFLIMVFIKRMFCLYIGSLLFCHDWPSKNTMIFMLLILCLR